MTNIAHIDISQVPTADQPKVIFVLEEIAARTGLRMRIFKADAPADAHKVTYDAAMYQPSPALAHGHHHTHFAEGRPMDVLGYGYRLLTLQDEMLIGADRRMKDGNIDPSALPESRNRRVAQPLFDEIAARFAGLLGHQPRQAPWPGGKRIALCVTHDTDMITLGHWAEIAYNAAKTAVYRSPRHGLMMMQGVRELFGHKRAVDGFQQWRDALGPINVPSTYYLSVRRRARAHINDVRSRVDNVATDWDALKRLADQGHEFGYHPQIHAKHDQYEFVEAKEYLQRHLGTSVHGLRHHYWALDWTAPHITLRKHVNAGFRYDTTMAWRNAYGFRTGTTLPHRAFDPGRNKPLDIYLIPTSIMDGYVLKQPATEADYPVLAAAVADCADKCRAHGGVLVLDWHTETSSQFGIYGNYAAYLAQVLTGLVAQGDVWLTTPWEVTKHVHALRKDLVEVV